MTAKTVTPAIGMTIWLLQQDDRQLPRMRGPLTVGHHPTRGLVALDESGNRVRDLSLDSRHVYPGPDECSEGLKSLLQDYIEFHTAQADECRLRLRRRLIVERVQADADRENPRQNAAEVAR